MIEAEQKSVSIKKILWWGRSDVDYSRNRIIRNILKGWGCEIEEFYPSISRLAGLQARARKVEIPDLVWVPCFRQRDYFSARRFANKHGLPLVFDPLTSTFDKQVFELGKYPDGSIIAEFIRRREARMFSSADIVLADTALHAQFFVDRLNANSELTFVVPVGAEEGMFQPQPDHLRGSQFEVLFYGSFVHLQGTDVIVDAARLIPDIKITLLGAGKLKADCEKAASNLPNVFFEDWIDYDRLPARIGQASIVLGIFGTTAKAERVIPNKLYQPLACARPVITRDSRVYGAELRIANIGGIGFVPPGDPSALANMIKDWADNPQLIDQRCANARELYDRFYSTDSIEKSLKIALVELFG